jgi:P-type Mg2+ transporter
MFPTPRMRFARRQITSPAAQRAPAQHPPLDATATQGLSTDEADRRLQQFGPNDPTPRGRSPVLEQAGSLLTNPLVIILFIAALVAGALGELANAIIIIVILLLSLLLNFIQISRSQRAVERLRKSVAPTATVLRDGVWIECPRTHIVVGDVIRLSAGDLVPADATLLQATDLHAQEAALTGESLPVEKEAAPNGAPDTLGETQRVFLGTSIISGTATALVTATGRATTFGGIATTLVERPPQTAFERGIWQFGVLIMRTVVFLVLFVFLIGVTFRHEPFESLLFAVALAVGLTPEFLPMITTVTLGQGAIRMARQHVVVKHLPAMQNFGSIDVLCSDKTGTLTSGALQLDQYLDPLGNPARKLLRLAYMNSAFETGIKSPLDAAILQQPSPDIQSYRKLDEIPFDFERRRLSVVVTDGSDPLLITKGAPESVLPLCLSYRAGDAAHPFDDATQKTSTTLYQALCMQGFRVLAIATRILPSQESYHVADEHDLTLEGFLAFSDPLLPEVADVVQALRQDGVQLKILTGDNELVTRHICEMAGLDVERIVLGSELDAMSPAALANIVENVTVFARVSPAQKNQIIHALHSRKHVVGFLGDGINDAPSLHTADVGISVATAVDVARDAADIILLQPGLRVLHNGIIEGRKAFGNVVKYLLMGTSSNFGNMFSMAGAFVFLPFLPMLPTQILLNNFLYDLSQVTIPTDRVDATFIHNPQHWDITLIRNFMIFIGPISSIFDFLTFFIMLAVFHAHASLFQTGWFVESLATQTLVLFVIRTAGNPFRSTPSRPLTVTILAVVLIGCLLPYTPLASFLGFSPLPPFYWLLLLGMISAYLLLVELAKRQLMRHLLK